MQNQILFTDGIKVKINCFSTIFTVESVENFAFSLKTVKKILFFVENSVEYVNKSA